MSYSLSDTTDENPIYRPVEKNIERLQSFEEKHPSVAGKAALSEKKAELEQRLAQLLGTGFVQRRITMPYTKLLEGRHNGGIFRLLKAMKHGKVKNEAISTWTRI